MSDYDVSSVSSISSSSTSTSETDSSDDSNTLGQEAFLELLVIELQHQDPLNPMDGTEYVTQLAQFSTVEQLTTMNDNMSSFLQYQGLYNGSSLIGKTVEINDAEVTGEVNKIAVEDGETYIYIDGEQYSVDDITMVYDDTDTDEDA
ncbi:flagellar hook capping FlgD N-terminal domain-containing protein [Halocella sp. SP3-1]|uniref:flagellar hook assembly protein FlgD n=1 Tax=Halocella sp. SP3-1 TaxID=2382161 RepID=UPI000F7505F7|nr:flagellar hook capping FlgD N-terminal domain-containing protein [Halocella sp. SP3-1]AZO95885.1 hypothetical protein D7D81_15525 [Halocella sp. SP3-1]